MGKEEQRTNPLILNRLRVGAGKTRPYAISFFAIQTLVQITQFAPTLIEQPPDHAVGIQNNAYMIKKNEVLVSPKDLL